jgi:hypothetical protein
LFSLEINGKSEDEQKRGVWMKDKKTKKALRAQYEERTITGGIYIIKNTHSGQILLESTTDLQGSRNRFEFAQKTGAGVSMKLQRDWSNLGAESFEFEVLETLERAETQTGEAFAEDLDVLKDYWLEKLKEKLFY